MSVEKRTEIARKGGIAAQAKGTGHRWNEKTGKAAGKIGGHISRGGRGKHQSTGTPTHPRAKSNKP
jgi:hypothetical protein